MIGLVGHVRRTTRSSGRRDSISVGVALVLLAARRRGDRASSPLVGLLAVGDRVDAHRAALRPRLVVERASQLRWRSDWLWLSSPSVSTTTALMRDRVLQRLDRAAGPPRWRRRPRSHRPGTAARCRASSLSGSGANGSHRCRCLKTWSLNEISPTRSFGESSREEDAQAAPWPVELVLLAHRAGRVDDQHHVRRLAVLAPGALEPASTRGSGSDSTRVGWAGRRRGRRRSARSASSSGRRAGSRRRRRLRRDLLVEVLRRTRLLRPSAAR